MRHWALTSKTRELQLLNDPQTNSIVDKATGMFLTSFPQRTANKFMVFHHSKCWKGLEQLSVLQEQLHMEKSKSE